MSFTAVSHSSRADFDDFERAGTLATIYNVTDSLSGRQERHIGSKSRGSPSPEDERGVNVDQ
eukprot:1157928-Pelagomonas_calceolata.AAC.1